jgi:hypothetical protein
VLKYVDKATNFIEPKPINIALRFELIMPIGAIIRHVPIIHILALSDLTPMIN